LRHEFKGWLGIGVSGLAIDPGSPDTNLLIIRQITANHPGLFSPEELNVIRH
jgi:hypothetical protein